MNEMIKLLIDIAWRVAPAPDRLSRTLAGILGEGWRSLWPILLFWGLGCMTALGLSLASLRGVGRFDGVEGSFLIILPDRYPDAQATLEQRKSATTKYVSEKLTRQLEAIKKKTGGVRYLHSTQLDSHGLLTIQVASFEHRRSLFKDNAAPAALLAAYTGVVQSIGEARIAAALMPLGTRSEQILIEPIHAGSEAQRQAALKAMLLGLGVASAGLFFYFSLKYNRVFDTHSVRQAFGADTRLLQIGNHADCRRYIQEGRVPDEFFILAEYLRTEQAKGKRRVAIISASPAVGKTTLALMLWRVLSQKHCVQLIDADRSSHLSRQINDSAFAAATRPRLDALFSHAGDHSALQAIPAIDADFVIMDITPLTWAREELPLLQGADLVLFVAQEIGYQTGLKETLERLKFLAICPDALIVNKVRRADLFGYGYSAAVAKPLQSA